MPRLRPTQLIGFFEGFFFFLFPSLPTAGSLNTAPCRTTAPSPTGSAGGGRTLPASFAPAKTPAKGRVRSPPPARPTGHPPRPQGAASEAPHPRPSTRGAEKLPSISSGARQGREDGSPLDWGSGGERRRKTPSRHRPPRPAGTELPCSATPRCCRPPPSRQETGLRRGPLQRGCPGGDRGPSCPCPPVLSALTHRSGVARRPPPSKGESPTPRRSGARHRQRFAIQDGGRRPAARRTGRGGRGEGGGGGPPPFPAGSAPAQVPAPGGETTLPGRQRWGGVGCDAGSATVSFPRGRRQAAAEQRCWPAISAGRRWPRRRRGGGTGGGRTWAASPAARSAAPPPLRAVTSSAGTSRLLTRSRGRRAPAAAALPPISPRGCPSALSVGRRRGGSWRRTSGRGTGSCWAPRAQVSGGGGWGGGVVAAGPRGGWGWPCSPGRGAENPGPGASAPRRGRSLSASWAAFSCRRGQPGGRGGPWLKAVERSRWEREGWAKAVGVSLEKSAPEQGYKRQGRRTRSVLRAQNTPSVSMKANRKAFVW